MASLFAKNKQGLAESREQMLDLYLVNLLRQPERVSGQYIHHTYSIYILPSTQWPYVHYIDHTYWIYTSMLHLRDLYTHHTYPIYTYLVYMYTTITYGLLLGVINSC